PIRPRLRLDGGIKFRYFTHQNTEAREYRNMNQEARWAPYCPPATLLQVIGHYRRRDVPEKLSKTDLLQIGVAEGLTNRTWNGLRFLHLIEPDGLTTKSFR